MRVNFYSLVTSSVAILLSCPCSHAQNSTTDAQTRRGYISSAALPPSASQTDAYPHIGALEKAILGQTYVGQTLTQRLARMETKAFGKVSTDPDLSQRTDNLEDYSQKTLHQKAWGAGSAADLEEREAAGGSESAVAGGGASSAGAGAGNSASSDGADGGEPQSPPTEYPHITNLEKEILGQTYPGQPLPDRIARMETKAFGKASTIQDYSERTDALEAYAQKKLHAKPFVQEQRQQAEAAGGTAVGGNGGGQSGGQSSAQSKIFSIVGNSLLSMAGVGRMGMAGPMGMMGGNPVFGQGMGGGMMPGFGGVRMRQKQQQDTQTSPTQQEAHPDDPAVNAATPPPTDAKMLTKVGWCEVQLFGHTFSNLHLPDRLKQLNQELNYAPGKSAIQLMDDAGGLIKAVQARKQGTRAASGASPTSAPVSASTSAPAASSGAAASATPRASASTAASTAASPSHR